ncbi:MAG: site-specific DNA-methyltransferase (adenine-specific) [Ignavibacteria bacterium]|nr:MAG: site-specific DNA-methyltransferase (adenine-specific) [Ignavibacteria bacterium]KAF0161793.1 MAG: site-specific DNA-methyltransferase (adenine-specific) [Ignavibacteria bacterium]
MNQRNHQNHSPDNYNPDVLTCLANLSSDEVFTPPNLVNQILDLLPKELWSNKEAKFLDPVCKSGVFLREIAKRLNVGLEKQIPNKQKRINHIYKNQLFGIAITELTSLLSRRSVYCSKTANGKYSVCDNFEDEQGNIKYSRLKHTWHPSASSGGNCIYCGASQTVYERGEDFETYAYNFIHTDLSAEQAGKLEEIFNMKFDVIIGNPPYQLSDGGFDKSASPIYHKFVEQAIKLNPRYLTMIIPARWYSGGKGLDEFRSRMLNDDRLCEIHDFPETSDVFPGLNIRGGVCYFLWDKEHKGKCKVTTYKNGNKSKTVERPLLEKGSEVFIRYNEAINILRKVQKLKEDSFAKIVSSRKPFGLPTNFEEYSLKKIDRKNILLYRFGDYGYVSSNQIEKNQQLIKKWKVIVPYASPGADDYPHLVLSKPIISEPNSCSTETYLVVGPFENEKICKNVAMYMCSSFARFLILLIKPSQHVTQKTYTLVPQQDFKQKWTDEKLYKKYGITKDEIAFIESIVRPMENSLNCGSRYLDDFDDSINSDK